MNPLTLVKRLNKINSTEASLGISEEASWHAKYKESAYVFVGGIPFDLTEGDLLAVFAQYGEVVDVNLVRDKGTGKSKGFAFIAYEDQRSTILAVDNLNGAKLLGRIVRVDHVSNYKKKEEEDEEKEQQKREARGVCRAFQRGDCTRGAGCKFSHDEQRSANTGWGAKDTTSRWDHDKYNGPSKNQRKSAYAASDHIPGTDIRERDSQLRSDVKDGGRSSAAVDDGDRKNRPKQNELILNGRDRRGIEKKPEWRDKEPTLEEDLGRQKNEKQSGKHVSEGRDGQGSRKRSRYDEDETEENPKDRYTRAGDKQPGRHDSEVRDRQASKKSSRHDEDKVEENLKDRYVRSSDKWSGRQETDQSKKVEKSGRRSENHSRHDGDGSERRSGQHDIEDNPKDNFDRQGSERHSRYDVMDTEPYAKEDRSMRENVKTSRHHSSRHRREEDASPRKRVGR